MVLARWSTPFFTEGIGDEGIDGGTGTFCGFTRVVSHTGPFLQFIGRDFKCIRYDIHTDFVHWDTGSDFLTGTVNYTGPFCVFTGFTYKGVGGDLFDGVIGYTGTTHWVTDKDGTFIGYVTHAGSHY